MKLSLGYSGPEVGTFLIFCAYWPSYNILVDIIFFRETQKFLDSDSSFRSHHLRHSSICQSRNILLSFTCKSLKFPLNFQVHPEIDLHSSLQFYLIFNKKNGPFLIAVAVGLDAFLREKTLFILLTTILDHMASALHPEHLQLPLCARLLVASMGFAIITHFREVPATSAFIFIMISPTTSASP